MARMHTKRHGRSKSRKPLEGEMGEPKETDRAKIVSAIVNYAKQGMEPAMIGQTLKQEYGMPYVKHHMGKRLVSILKENGVAPSLPSDLMDLMKKAVNTKAHLERNKQDLNNRLRMRRIESKIWRLTKYYINRGVLPQGWRYDPKQAELLIKRTS